MVNEVTHLLLDVPLNHETRKEKKTVLLLESDKAIQWNSASVLF